MLISIVHASDTGRAAKQASAVAEGVRSVRGVACRLVNLSTDEVPWGTLEASAAIVFGSPCCNGTVSARVEQFFEESASSVWPGLRWRDKVAAGFTSSASRDGDDLGALVTMAAFAAQHGMVWVGVDLLPGGRGRGGPDRRGRSLGATARPDDREGPDARLVETDVRTAAYLGHRVAKTARRMAAALER